MNLHAVVRAANRAADELVQRNLTRYRAPLRERTVFTQAGRTVVHAPGERVIYGPSGAVLGRVIEDEHGGTQIEQNDRLHAVIRPQTVTRRARGETPHV